MKKKTTLLLISSLLYGVDIGMINVDAKASEQSEEVVESFSDIFMVPEYFEKVSRLENAPAQKRLTIQEAMFIPGVQGDPVKAIMFQSGVTTSNDTSGELFVYGSKPQESVVSIDHLPIGYLFHMGGLHSVISPQAIEQIDMYLGGFDASYGDAMGGVIEITPKYPSSENSGYGHMGIYDASAGLNVALSDDVNLYFGARRSYFDLALKVMGKDEGDLNEDGTVTYQEFPNYYDGTLLLTYNVDDYSIFSFEMIGAKDTLKINTQEASVKDPEATGNIKDKKSFITYGARYRFEGDNYSSQTLAYYMFTQGRTDLFDKYYVDVENNLYGLYHESIYELNQHQLMAGFEANKLHTPVDLFISPPPTGDAVDNDFTSATKYRVKENFDIKFAALFLQDKYSYSDNLTFKVGSRIGYSTFEKLGLFIDPRISSVYALNEKSNISFSVGQYTQTPEGYKLTDDMGNKNLEYEQAYHYILHYDYSFLKNSKFVVEPFYKKFKYLAIDDATLKYVSSGDGESYGLDISTKVREGDWYGFLAYTYLRASRQLDTKSDKLHTFYGEVPHTLQFLGSYKFASNWVFSALTKYHSGGLYTPVNGTYDDNGRVRPIYGEAFSSRFDDYFTLNVKLAQNIKLKHSQSFEWSFEIMNLTNHDNISGIEYDDNYKIKGYTKQLPLLPWFDMTYKF